MTSDQLPRDVTPSPVGVALGITPQDGTSFGLGFSVRTKQGTNTGIAGNVRLARHLWDILLGRSEGAAHRDCHVASAPSQRHDTACSFAIVSIRRLSIEVAGSAALQDQKD